MWSGLQALLKQKDPGAEYVTRAELNKLAAIVAEMKAKKKRKVEEEEDDE